MSDEQERELKRRADCGDKIAGRQLERFKHRRGEYLPPHGHHYYRIRKNGNVNRNAQRRWAHERGRCRPENCRFCRRYGQHTRGVRQLE